MRSACTALALGRHGTPLDAPGRLLAALMSAAPEVVRSWSRRRGGHSSRRTRCDWIRKGSPAWLVRCLLLCRTAEVEADSNEIEVAEGWRASGVRPGSVRRLLAFWTSLSRPERRLGDVSATAVARDFPLYARRKSRWFGSVAATGEPPTSWSASSGVEGETSSGAGCTLRSSLAWLA